jgi:SAM-dependent methyltransferase
MTFRKLFKPLRRKRRQPWQQVSLVAGFLAGRHFVGTHDLHYGYWLDDVAPEIRNLPRAQEDYSNFLLGHIPNDAVRILDVGSGAGTLALQLLQRGHSVDCVSPSSFLNKQAQAMLGDRARLFECRYEDFETSEEYDAILFCESFQYVNMQLGLDKVTSQLRPGGQLIICDFFRIPADGKSPISGGHRLNAFQETIARFPLRLVEDIDMTSRTAPTFTVIDKVFSDVLQPTWREVEMAFAKNHPVWSRWGRWLFRKRLAKFENKYFTHQRIAANFEKFKTYRLMRFVLEK